MSRPFEIGDLLKIRFNNQDLWATALSKNNNGGCGRCDDNGRLFFKHDDILTIRSPRKGSKEARDIVAMLARKYREAAAKNKPNNESEFKRGARIKDKFSKSLMYAEAKLMLK